MATQTGKTIFMGRVNGKIVFWDWAVVHTLAGDMIEPFNYNRDKSNGEPFDPSEPTDMITNVVEVDFNKIASMKPFGDNGLVLHGGGSPKTGY